MLTDSIEGPIATLVLIANVFSINVFFLIPGVINIIFVVGFFLYCKKPIILIKQLDLRLKSPVFNMVGEMISSLIQIRIFKRRFYLLNQFAKKINESFRGNICFWNLSRAFGANICYFSIMIVCIGWTIGIGLVRPETAGLYGVSIVFLIKISDEIQWFLRQFIVL